ncbi:MAG: S1 RNA-binding domain-containing protein, partial [Chlamydiae bacterium]|nr:S1 RNA-binding domain-containing protein [Chlamydiota bacterium]
TERRSFKAENSVLNLKKLRYLKKLQESKSYEEFDATITKVRANGLIFDLNFLSFEGFIHIASLEKEYFHYSDRAACFVGENSKKKLYVGMAIKVKIEYVDLLFQECRWKIVEY